MSTKRKSASARKTRTSNNLTSGGGRQSFSAAFLMEETNMYDDSYYDYLDYIEGKCMNDSEGCGLPEEDDDEDS